MIVVLPVLRTLPPEYPGWLPTSQYARIGQAIIPEDEQLRRMNRSLGAGGARRRLEELYLSARNPNARLGAAELAAALDAPPPSGEPAVVSVARRAAQALVDAQEQ